MIKHVKELIGIIAGIVLYGWVLGFAIPHLLSSNNTILVFIGAISGIAIFVGLVAIVYNLLLDRS